MQIKANKIVDFIDKSFSIKPNGYQAEDFAALLAIATAYKGYVETINDKSLPNSDTLHYRVKKDTDVLSLLEKFLNITKKYLPKLKGKKAQEIEEALDYIEGYGIKTKAGLFDRGFADSKILNLLRERRIKYLMLYPKHRNIKKIIEQTKRRYINRKFKVRDVETRLVIGKEEKITWVFVTNMEFADIVKYIRLYKKRWNIETGFRMQDEAQIRTKSKRIEIRYFYFLVALLLYNCWKILKAKISFRRFLIEIQRGVECACKHLTKPT
jgi:hypothetical protein